MLIVAIPKSASTSLMVTMGKLHKKMSHQIYFPENTIPSNIRLLHRYHSDLRELSENHVRQFSGHDQFYKQHIAPTESNLKFLMKVKKVILLRNPELIIGAYYRAEISGLHTTRREFSLCKTLDDWHEIAEKNGLLDDLRWFYNTWIKEALRFPEVNLVVRHEDLLHNSTKVVNDIERFFDLQISGVVNLSKTLYSRSPVCLLPFRYLKRKALLLIDRYPIMHSIVNFIKYTILRTSY